MKGRVKDIAKELGFDLIGFSKCKKVTEEFAEFYFKWIKNNFHGDLKYLERNIEKRFNPKNLLPSGKTIISLGVNYYSEIPQDCIFPRYLTKVDYHIVIKNMLKEFVEILKKEIKDLEYNFFVDSGPILEKYWAKKSGIGFIGKNSLIINPKFGSFIFLCEVIINKEFDEDKEIENLCGNCEKCIESCPTGAITKEGIIDVTKCISYLTIEKKELTEEERKIIKKGNKIFGCEICQEVCPFNKDLKETEKDELKIAEKLKDLKFEELKNVSLLQLKELFKTTAVRGKLIKLNPNFPQI
ncbi:MAG: tRNA epoxyqueuosine(34) reductase QueG [Candidatus Omnitrophica bacterium]|nr:tRNA epoxyqueuosine(34) reductase QueG [Candidatus Omnitrophota bacterium]